MQAVFVGREPERSLLTERLRAALDGEGSIVLVAGEPGVGKSRLAEAIMGQASDLGVRSAVGRANEDDGSPPYWPFLQLFRTLGVAGVPIPGEPSPRERFHLFEAVTGALLAAAEANGLLVVLDDVQWADVASLRLLAHLAMGVRSSRLMVVATYRDTETVRQPFRAVLAALIREPTVTRIRMTGLAESEVAALLAGVTGWPVPATVASAVCRRTKGNPFFVVEMGRVLTSSMDGQLPDGVRDAVRDRLARLSDSCRAVVCAAAVLGSEVDPVAVSAASERGLHHVLAALDEAAAAGIVGGSPAVRFEHDIVREVARLEMPTAARLALHQRMAEHLAARGDADARVAQIAYHQLESLPAGDAAQAVAWAERAASQAARQLAWRRRPRCTAGRSMP